MFGLLNWTAAGSALHYEGDIGPATVTGSLKESHFYFRLILQFHTLFPLCNLFMHKHTLYFIHTVNMCIRMYAEGRPQCVVGLRGQLGLGSVPDEG